MLSLCMLTMKEKILFMDFSTKTIAIIVSMMFVLGVTAIPTLASTVVCTVTVTAPSSIQVAVDASSPGDTICLSGTFSQSVEIGPEDSGITLISAPSATLDGTGPADPGTTIDPNAGIKLLDGVIDIEIISLELTGYSGFRGSGISAWDVSTTNIIVRNNHIHDNTWNGILVGSEGGFIHDNWDVRENLVEDNGFVGIELTNVENSKIRDNVVRDNFLTGILIQARNTIGTSVFPIVSNVDVKENEVSGTGVRPGIWFLSLESLTTGPPFPPAGALALITDSKVRENYVHDNNADGIRLQAFNAGAAVDDIDVKENTVTDNTGNGIKLLNTDDSKIEENTATDNGVDILQDGDSTGNEFEDNTCNSSSGGIDCP